MTLSWLFSAVASVAAQDSTESSNVKFYGHLPKEYKSDLVNFHRDWATFIDTRHPLDKCFQNGTEAWLRWTCAAGYRVTSLATAPADTLLLDFKLRNDKLKNESPPILTSIVDAERSNEILFRFW